MKSIEAWLERMSAWWCRAFHYEISRPFSARGELVAHYYCLECARQWVAPWK